MSRSRSRANSTANWLAVVAGLLTAFLLFLIYLANILSRNGFLG